MSINPENLHGNHYTEAQFDAEVEARLEAKKSQLGDDWVEDDAKSYRRHFVRNVYFDWNEDADEDDFIQFEMMHSLKYFGTSTMGYVKADSENPLEAPIHGISLDDYAAIAMNLTTFDENELFKAFGIDTAIWQEVNTLWPKRMQEDSTFTIVNLYGEAFMKAPNHPKILALKNGSAQTNEGNSDNLDRLKTDKAFYLELEAARSVAYEYGIDGAQWIKDEFGIDLMDFQSVAMEWMTKRNMNFSTDQIREDADFQESVRAHYKERFAADQGGNVADDIEF